MRLTQRDRYFINPGTDRARHGHMTTAHFQLFSPGPHENSLQRRPRKTLAPTTSASKLERGLQTSAGSIVERRTAIQSQPTETNRTSGAQPKWMPVAWQPSTVPTSTARTADHAGPAAASIRHWPHRRWRVSPLPDRCVVVPSTSVRPRLPASGPAARLIANPLPRAEWSRRTFQIWPYFPVDRGRPLPADFCSSVAQSRQHCRPAFPPIRPWSAAIR